MVQVADPDGRTLASGSGDGTVWLWDVATSQPIGTPLTGSRADPVLSVAFSPDGRTLASDSRDGTVRLWDFGYLANVAAYLCLLAAVP